MSNNELADKTCAPCNGNTPVLTAERSQNLLRELHSDWRINNDGRELSRRYVFKGFAKSVYLSNLCVWLADQQEHHPDIAFGWGYCQVTITTHVIGGLSENDFIWAAQLDKLTA